MISRPGVSGGDGVLIRGCGVDGGGGVFRVSSLDVVVERVVEVTVRGTAVSRSMSRLGISVTRVCYAVI